MKVGQEDIWGQIAQQSKCSAARTGWPGRKMFGRSSEAVRRAPDTRVAKLLTRDSSKQRRWESLGNVWRSTSRVPTPSRSQATDLS